MTQHIRSKAYLTINEKLKELNTFKTSDLWKGQVTTSATIKSNPVVYPASFVSIGAIQWEDMTMNIQEGKLKIMLYLFFNKYGDTFDGASDQLDSLEILDTLNDVVEKTQWLSAENHFTELTQTNEQDVTERYGRPAYILTFEADCYNKLKLPNYVYN